MPMFEDDLYWSTPFSTCHTKVKNPAQIIKPIIRTFWKMSCGISCAVFVKSEKMALLVPRTQKLHLRQYCNETWELLLVLAEYGQTAIVIQFIYIYYYYFVKQEFHCINEKIFIKLMAEGIFHL